MRLKSTKFSGLKLIKTKIHRDSRGFFKEDFKQKLFKKSKFIFGCTSSSKKNVLRGMHIQAKVPQGKHVSVLKGSILDVVVDLRKNSSTFGRYFKTILSDKNGKSVLIPPGFAHGFLGLKKENIVYYKLSNYYYPKYEGGIMWDDKDLNVNWPVKKPKLSFKDKNLLTYENFLKKFKHL